MARGNVYLTIPKSKENDKVPSKINARYGWTEIDNEGNDVAVHPTWLQLQEKVKGQFGVPTYRKKGGSEYLIMELNLSYLQGQVSEFEDLGVGLQPPNFTIWEKGEILSFDWDVEEQV